MPPTEHTPGPWQLTDFQDGGLAMVEGRYLRIMVDHREDFGRALPDARLIASAPELLDAAKAAKEFLEPDLVEPGRTIFWKLVDAIAKAEGRDHAAD